MELNVTEGFGIGFSNNQDILKNRFSSYLSSGQIILVL